MFDFSKIWARHGATQSALSRRLDLEFYKSDSIFIICDSWTQLDLPCLPNWNLIYHIGFDKVNSANLTFDLWSAALKLPETKFGITFLVFLIRSPPWWNPIGHLAFCKFTNLKLRFCNIFDFFFFEVYKKL